MTKDAVAQFFRLRPWSDGSWRSYPEPPGDGGDPPPVTGNLNARHPRRGGYLIGSPHDYDTLANRQFWANVPLLVYNHYNNWQTVGPRSLTMAATLADMRTRAAAGVGATQEVYSYVISNETFVPPDGATQAFYDKVVAENWWVYRVGTSGTRATSFFDTNLFYTNATSFCPNDGNGQNLSQWSAGYFYGFNVGGVGTNAPNNLLAGLFWDNAFWKTRGVNSNNPTGADWDRDGDTDNDNNPTINAGLRAGNAQGWAAQRVVWPGGKIIANIADWPDVDLTGLYTSFSTTFNYSELGPMHRALEGGVLEYAIDGVGVGVSNTGFSKHYQERPGSGGGNGTQVLANQYRFLAGTVTTDRVIVCDHTISATPSTATHYRRLRYGWAHCEVFSDFYYYPCPNTFAPNLRPDYDEWHNAGTAYGWLGQPAAGVWGLPQVSAYQNGVFRRDFENGVVLCNPMGNGSRVVQLPFAVRKIAGRSGFSDTSVNNGAIITAGSNISLSDEDGLFLLKVNSPPTWDGIPAPPAGTQGVPATYSLATLAVDPEGDPVTLSSVDAGGNPVALPSGWSLTQSPLALVYSGGGSVGAVTARLRATSTGGSVVSAPFTLTIQASAPVTDVTTLSLVSAVGGTDLPWTAGQAFRQGDVPSGQYVTSDEPVFQAVVKNRWPDGSVKFAILSGRTTLTANVAKSIKIQRTGTAPGGTNIAEAALIAAAPAVPLVISGGSPSTVNGTITLASLLGTAAKVREYVVGPQMYEAHYKAAAGSDAHLVAWFMVRYYAGGPIEVETVVENGFLRVASPGRRTYNAILSVNGTQRFSGPVTHEHHTRWSRWDWYGSDPQVIATPNLAYLKATKLVPNAPAASPGTQAWSANGENWNALAVPATEANSGAPFALGNYANPISAGGDAASIGLLPAWEMLYLASGDARAYTATLVNSRNFGRYPLCYRDESTGKAPRLTQLPDLAFGANAGWNYGFGDDTDKTPDATTTIPSAQVVDSEHQPSAPYLAYLLTGRYQFVEACQFAAASTLISRAGIRGGASCLYGLYYDANEDAGRVWAWGLRQAVWAACITPDSDTTMQGEFRTIVDNNVADRLSKVTTGATANNLGIVAFFDAETPVNGYRTNKPWMLAFFATVLGHAYDLEVNTDATARSTHSSLLSQVYKFVVGIHGNGSGYNYRRAGIYRFAQGGSAGPAGGAAFLADWNAVYSVSMANLNVGGTAFPAISSADGLSLSNMVLASFGSTPYERPIVTPGVLPLSYNIQVAAPLAYAVDHGAAGALAAYDRFVTSSSFSAYAGELANRPKWRIAPRGSPAVSALSVQSAALAAGAWSGDIASASLNTPDGSACKPLTGLRSGVPTTMVDWGSKVAWDSVNRRMFIVGSPAGTNVQPNAGTMARYDEPTDTWSRTANPFSQATYSFGHTYDNYDIDSAGRRLFKHEFNGDRFVFAIYVYNLDSGAVSTIPSPGLGQNVTGLAWFPTLGTQGSLIVCGNTSIRRYDFASAAWSTVASATLGDGCFAHYNPASDSVVCGGGNSASARVYRVSNTGTVTDHGVQPRILSIYNTASTHALVMPHPSTSAVLAFCGDATVRSMSAAGTWSTIGSIPPGLRNPDVSDAVWNTVGVPVRALGVVLFAQHSDVSGNSKAFIYKAS